MKASLNHKQWAVLIFGAALIVRLIYLLQIKSNPFFLSPMVDELWNIRWATDILEKSFFGDEVYFRGPLYPYLLAFWLKITSADYFWIRLIQMFISAASVSLTYLLGREFFSERVARLASVFHALYAMLIFYEAMFLIPVIFIFLNLLGLLILARNRDNPLKKPYLLAGLIFGLAAIARPNILLIVPLLGLWLFFHFRGKIKTRSIAVLLLVFFLGLFLPIAPVTVRNYVVADDPVLISSQGGVNLYIGNNTVAEGLTMMMPEIRLDSRISWDQFTTAVADYAKEDVGHDLKPSDVSAYWTNKAKQFIFEHPDRFLGLTFRKLVYFFSGFENSDQTDIYDFRQYSSVMSILVFDYGLKFPYGFFAPLGLLGLWLCRRRFKELAPLLIFFFAYIPTVILFLVTARHRLTVIPVLLLFAAFALIWLYDQIKKRDWKRILMPAGMGLVLLIILNINFFDLGFRNEPQIHFNLAMTHSRQGDYEAAIREYRLALEQAPSVPSIYNGLGQTYFNMGRFQDAIRQLSHAVSLDSEYGDAQFNLGLAYMEMNEFDRAERHLRAAAELMPDRAEPLINLSEVHMGKNDPASAVDVLERVLDIDPDNHIVYTKLGVLYGRAGDTAAAFGYFDQSLQIAPGYAPGYLNWGNILLINGDTTAAIDKYQKAVGADTMITEPLYNLAVVYIRTGDLANARKSVEALLKIAPDNKRGLQLKRRLEN
ncbi:MAG: tetratricopeptide repeat protein [FCB group bacterium]|nr:tetratricopeptide repeat protein [FCB group bacterium]